MAGVETSDMYMGTIIVSMPTEKPAIARPAKSMGSDPAAACRAEPSVGS